MPKLFRQYLSTMRAIHYFFTHFLAPAKFDLREKKKENSCEETNREGISPLALVSKSLPARHS
jgi:hypothetical protein